MAARDVLETFDQTPGTASMKSLQPLFIQSAAEGALEIEWESLLLDDDRGNRLEMLVTRDAIKLRNVRIAVSASTLQRIADEVEGIMLTERLGDLIYQEATVKLEPLPGNVNDMSKAHMVRQSARVDAAIAGRSGLVADPGKDWVLTNKLLKTGRKPPLPNFPMMAANNGWRVTTQKWQGIKAGPTTIPGIYGIQSPPGTHHDRSHVDYSQMGRLAHRKAVLNGKAVDLADVYISAEMAHLVSAEGPVPTRQPGTGRISAEHIPERRKANRDRVVVASLVGAAAGAVAAGAGGAAVGAVAGGILATAIGRKA